MLRRNFLKTIMTLGTEAAVDSILSKSIFSQEFNESQNIWKELKESVEKLKTKFGLKPNELAIIINPANQRLYLIRGWRS